MIDPRAKNDGGRTVTSSFVEENRRGRFFKRRFSTSIRLTVKQREMHGGGGASWRNRLIGGVRPALVEKSWPRWRRAETQECAERNKRTPSPKEDAECRARGMKQERRGPEGRRGKEDYSRGNDATTTTTKTTTNDQRPTTNDNDNGVEEGEEDTEEREGERTDREGERRKQLERGEGEDGLR